MKNSRRKFLRSTSIAATGIVLASNARKSKNLQAAAASCATLASEALTGSVKSIKTGNWSDTKTWSSGKVPSTTDSPLIVSGHIVTLDADATVAGLSVDAGGTFLFSTTKSTTLQTNKNVVIEGLLKMYPASSAVIQTLRFINVDESKFVGLTMDPVASDVGLWIMGAGKWDVLGTAKTSYSTATASVTKGSTSFTVKDATGWQVGDEIVIVPTDQPEPELQDYDEKAGTIIDSFFNKFERRIITAISGTKVTFATALAYDHLAYSSSITSTLGNSSRSWFPEVANLSRNVRVEGTRGATTSYKDYKRAHIFIRSTVPQSIKYLQGKYLGPRKFQEDNPLPDLIIGRYGLHFHHCEDGSRGSVVLGCALVEIGSRSYVPHVSHGVTLTQNVAFDGLEEAFWYDFQDVTHDIFYDRNLMAAIRNNANSNRNSAMVLGEGDNNKAIGNIAVYANSGVEHNGGGAYDWQADAEGVWVFENNMAHSCTTGILVWQNTTNNHTIFSYDSYNCFEGICHGAYMNNYTYTGGHHYKSKVFIEAASMDTAGVIFQDMFMDAGTNPYAMRIIDSPLESMDNCPNRIINCVYRNYAKAGIQMATPLPDGDSNKGYKQVDLILNDFSTGTAYLFDNTDDYRLPTNSRIRLQPLSGQPVQTLTSGGKDVKTNIGAFAPTVWGKGTGLTGQYYNGSAFDSLALTRVDCRINFQNWTISPYIAPTGVHYSIKGDAFSVRWTGDVEAQYSESHVFYLQGSACFRLWVNNQLILDSWTDRYDNAAMVASTPITLVAGKRYAIKIETANTTGYRGCVFYWKSASMPITTSLYMSQLYPTSSGSVTPTTLTANAGVDATITKPTTKTTLTGTVTNAGTASLTYLWTKTSGPDSYTIASKTARVTDISSLTVGTYVFRMQVTASDRRTAEDYVTVTVNKNLKKANLKVSVAPNPTPTAFTVGVGSEDTETPFNVMVYNARQAKIEEYKNLKIGATITFGHKYEKGMYYIIVEQGEERQTVKLMKAN